MGFLYKYTAGEEAIRRLLEDQTIRYTPPLSLNDPFECGVHTDEVFQRFGGAKNERFLDSLDTTDEDIRHFNAFALRHILQRTIDQQYGVLSLTPVPDSLLMWSHYAMHHTGFAVGFDDHHPFFNPTRDDGRSLLVPVRYAQGKVTRWKPGVLFERGSVDEELERSIFDWFFLKSQDWAYEKEVRMIAMLNSPTLFDDAAVPGVTRFPKGAVTEIVIGSNASAETVRRVYAVHARSFAQAKLRVAWLDPSRFRVNLRAAPPLEFMDRFERIREAPILPLPPYGRY